MSHRIEPGQEYERHDPAEGVTTRIRVVALSVTGGRPFIATVTPDGGLLRRRQIHPRQLHDDPERVTGYRLVRHADWAGEQQR